MTPAPEVTRAKRRPTMTNTTLFLVVVGAATVTSWMFRIIDGIEAPAKRRNRT